MNTLREELTQLFRQQLNNSTLHLHDHTTAKDIPGLDSLKHVSIIVAIEKKFKVTLTADEILSVKKHRDLEELLLKKLSRP